MRAGLREAHETVMRLAQTEESDEDERLENHLHDHIGDVLRVIQPRKQPCLIEILTDA